MVGAVAVARADAPRYRAVNETAYGKAFVAERRDATSVSAAIRLTLADAAGYFGVQPVLHRAYEDARDHRSGGATFTIDAPAGALHGWISCTLGGRGARVAVAVIRRDAPSGEWQRLLRPNVSSGTSPRAAAASHAPLRRYVFPDGVASIGLAPGWTSPTRDAMQGARVVGPEGQVLSISISLPVQLPQSPLARQPGALVAPFTAPAEAMQQLAPQLSRLSAARGGPASAFDHVVTVEQRPASQGRQAMLRYGVTEQTRGGASTHHLAMALVGMLPTSQFSWMLTVTELRAPDAIFERDLPLMLAMVNSVELNEARVRDKSQRQLAAQNQWFAAQQRNYRAQQAANDAQHARYWQTQAQNAQANRNWEDGQLAQARRDDNFDELIRGYRTVEDTQTGERRSVDYLNVDKIVDDLHERDPGRYHQIPLRDENHPL